MIQTVDTKFVTMISKILLFRIFSLWSNVARYNYSNGAGDNQWFQWTPYQNNSTAFNILDTMKICWLIKQVSSWHQRKQWKFKQQSPIAASVAWDICAGCAVVVLGIFSVIIANAIGLHLEVSGEQLLKITFICTNIYALNLTRINS